MRVLHLSSSYPYTDLYKNLIHELDNKGIQQIMYVALKNKHIENKRILDEAQSIEYVFSYPFNYLDRFIYYSKMYKISKDIEKSIDLKKINLVHAHFLFTDGGVAYQLKKKYGIEYIVAVRNSDINFFFKYGLHIRNYGLKILREAQKIIFITPSYKEQLLKRYIPNKLITNIDKKMLVIPNGIDKFWTDNIYMDKPVKVNDMTLSLIFIGELNENKNIMTSLQVFEELKKRGYQVNFNIVGNGPLEATIKEWIQKTNNQKFIILHGYVSEKKRLLKLYRQSDIFIMPSLKETFGLVYIEAMSQGLPVIYTEGEGIDGYFKQGHVGYAANPKNVLELSNCIERIINNYDVLSRNAKKESVEFNWADISESYIDLYNIILNK